MNRRVRRKLEKRANTYTIVMVEPGVITLDRAINPLGASHVPIAARLYPSEKNRLMKIRPGKTLAVYAR